MFIFRDKVLKERNQKCLAIYEFLPFKAGKFQSCIGIQIIFLCLVEEKGPVPLKVGLIVVEVGWCPCTVQSLYSL